ncbi:MAG: hypothetical protein GY913_16420 [Proteobacteria bacterium]|nr:hypothetical protein [Pseudomonadota bacterium]MCP4918490.1 hypothetical protein [Pseudomonadota bacterium]
MTAAWAAPPPGVVLAGAADGTRGEITLMATAFSVEDRFDGSGLQGGMLRAEVGLDDRIGVTLGVAHDRYDNGWLPHAAIHGLVVDQEHFRLGLHAQGGSWLHLNPSDEGQDVSTVGAGWSMQAGGDRVVFDIARTPVKIDVVQTEWGVYWEPWRGDVQETGLTVHLNDHHALRAGVLTYVPILTYGYTRGPLVVRATAGASRFLDMDYNAFGLQVGWTGQAWGA